jgi:cytochrome c2
MLKGARKLAVLGTRAAACTILVSFLPLPGPVQAQDADQGQQTFQTLCAACHTIGGGRLVGPDLQGVAERRSEQWFIDFVQRSQELVQAGDADAVAVFEEYNRFPMPDQPLSDDEVRGVLAYIGSFAATEAAGTETAAPPIVPAATDEQVVLGRDLFQGMARLANGGPPCMSCHDVRSEGVVGGGALAIGLTDAVTRLTLPGVGAILRNPPFPVMQRAYADRPLTDPEVEALVGFLERADAEQELHQARAYGMQFLLAGVVGSVILLGLYALIWRRRRKGTVYETIFDRQVIST